MLCQVCGVEAPTKKVTFYQHMGAIVLMFTKTMKGKLCKSCINKTFWKFSLMTLFLGWWGVISFFLTPLVLLNNFIRYLFCLSMDAVPENASVPELTEKVITNLEPHVESIFNRLESGEELEKVYVDVARKSYVSPGQVALYVQAVVENAKASA